MMFEGHSLVPFHERLNFLSHNTSRRPWLTFFGSSGVYMVIVAPADKAVFCVSIYHGWCRSFDSWTLLSPRIITVPWISSLYWTQLDSSLDLAAYSRSFSLLLRQVFKLVTLVYICTVSRTADQTPCIIRCRGWTLLLLPRFQSMVRYRCFSAVSLGNLGCLLRHFLIRHDSLRASTSTLGESEVGITFKQEVEQEAPWHNRVVRQLLIEQCILKVTRKRCRFDDG